MVNLKNRFMRDVHVTYLLRESNISNKKSKYKQIGIFLPDHQQVASRNQVWPFPLVLQQKCGYQ